MTDKFFAWTDLIKSLDRVKLPTRVENLIRTRKKFKDPHSSAFRSIEERVRRNLHSIDMKVPEGEKRNAPTGQELRPLGGRKYSIK